MFSTYLCSLSMNKNYKIYQSPLMSGLLKKNQDYYRDYLLYTIYSSPSPLPSLSLYQQFNSTPI